MTTDLFTTLCNLLQIAQSTPQQRGRMIGMLIGSVLIFAIGYIMLKLRKPPKK